MYKTVDMSLQSVLRHFPLNRWLLLQTQQIQNWKLVQERRLPWHVSPITIRGRTFRGRIRWAVTHQTNFKFQPNLNPKIASRESMAQPTSFPRQFPRRRKEEAARTDWVCSKKCLLPDPPVGSRLLVGTSLLVKLSRRNRNQTLLFLIRIDLYLSAQVGSGGNERDECHPVDFNAPRGWIDIMHHLLEMRNFPRCMRSLTTTTWNARRSWSARWWGSPSTSATCPASWSQASSKWTQNKSHFWAHFHLSLFQDGAIPWGPEHAGWLQGAAGRVHGRLREVRWPEGLRGVLPVPLLNQGVGQEELLRELPLEETPLETETF